MGLWQAGLIVLLFNLPFGYWRANVPRASLQWLLAIHVPVPFVIALRVFGGLGWDFVTFPVLIGAFTAGQLLGSWLLLWTRSSNRWRASSCLVMDVVRAAQVTAALR